MALLNVKVVPGASRSEVVGRYGDGIKLRVSAPPEGGRANREVIALLSSALGVEKRRVTIVRGHSSAQKLVQVEELELEEALRRLVPASRSLPPGSSARKSRRG